MLLSKEKRGFTLVELIVTITIIAVLFLTALPTYNKARRLQELNSAVTLLVDVMEKTRQYSINPRNDTKESIGGYCFQIFPGQGAKWQVAELSAVSAKEKSFCSSGQVIEKGILPSSVIVSCDKCEVSFSSVGNKIGIPEISKPVIVKVQGEKINVIQSVKLNQNGVVNENSTN